MKFTIILVLVCAALMYSCGGEKGNKENAEKQATPAEQPAAASDPMQNKGIGPISSVTLGEIDTALVTEGEAAFKAKCTACHKISKKFVGPALQGVTQRRSPEWIMNMILNPEEMIQKDPIAQQLIIEFNGAPMANQNLSQDEARAILEYFRTKN